MDFLRMEGESTFLSLLPPESKQAEIELWYRNSSDKVIEYLASPNHNELQKPPIAYKSDNHKKELLALIKDRLEPVLTNKFSIDSIPDKDIRKQLHRLERFEGKHVAHLPELSFIQIVDKNGSSTYVSLLKNVAHLSMSSLLKEEKNLIEEEFNVTVANNLLGSYPNALFKVKKSELPDFIENMLIINSADDYVHLRNPFGVLRTDPEFWEISDRLHDNHLEHNPVTYGIFDYNRLEAR
jgi:hypothetical protein